MTDIHIVAWSMERKYRQYFPVFIGAWNVSIDNVSLFLFVAPIPSLHQHLYIYIYIKVPIEI